MLQDPLLGTVIGRYRVLRALGRGGMGRVYLAEHTEIGSPVAIKVLAEEWADSPDLLERFFAEARVVNLIRHENIVAVLDLDRMANGRPFIVMEYIAGKSLRQVMEAGPAALGGVVHAMLEVLLALEAAHAAGVVHRDLKPDNVMLMPSGRTRLVDFGVAKLATATSRTRTGALLGTPEYMAPEQISGGEVDARADLYAVGVMLFELCTGQRPFAGATDYQLMEAHLRGVPPSARALRPDLPVAIEEVIGQALAKRADERFVGARAMANALRLASAALRPEDWQPLAVEGVEPAAAVSFEALPVARETAATAPRQATEGRLDQPTQAMRPRAEPPPAPPGARRSARAGSLIAGGFAVAAAGATAVVLLSGRSTGPVAIDAAPPPPPPIDAAPADAAPPLVDAAVIAVPPPPGPPGAFDATSWLPAARDAARATEADAEFVGLEVTVRADGRTDPQPGNVVARFHSPTASIAGDRPPCLEVRPSPGGILVTRSRGCVEWPVRLPACHTLQVYPGKVPARPHATAVKLLYERRLWTVEPSDPTVPRQSRTLGIHDDC